MNAFIFTYLYLLKKPRQRGILDKLPRAYEANRVLGLEINQISKNLPNFEMLEIDLENKLFFK
jgi:hypothetical protein